MRGATEKVATVVPSTSISIHAPRAGRDGARGQRRCHPRPISIHAPRAGRDPHGMTRTPRRRYFNPRAPCGARPSASSPRTLRSHFNPRAPCGARQRSVFRLVAVVEFQSTRPVRGATDVQKFSKEVVDISIHAPRAGRDPCPRTRASRGRYFNPRAPCGARRPARFLHRSSHTFQSTRPVRGATG